MASLLDDSIALLRQMVATPSPTFEETAVRDLIGATLSAWGIDHAFVRNNILALHPAFDAARPTLLLCAHIDTVPVCEGYAFDPFRPDYAVAAEVLGLTDDFVAGLGANDDGGSVAAMLTVFRHFHARGDAPVNLLLALTCEEERSGANGAAHLWNDYWGAGAAERPFPRPDFAIIGEPTAGCAAVAERGLLVLDGEAKGVSGHAAREEGVNALYIALDDIGRLRAFDFDRLSPLLGKVKLTVTQIAAGSVHNVVPDSCRFVVDIRPTEQYDNAEILAALRAVCQSTLIPRNLLNRSSATRPASPFWPLLAELHIETYASPTTSDWMRTPCDAIKLGPGRSERSHRKNEFVLRAEIADAVEKYTALIERFPAVRS